MNLSDINSRANYHITFLDDGEETVADVVFFGMQDGNLLFARPATLKHEKTPDLPPVAPETKRMSDHWQSEGAESVEVLSYAVEEVLTISADWSVLASDADR
jgi:hypothetical protein